MGPFLDLMKNFGLVRDKDPAGSKIAFQDRKASIFKLVDDFRYLVVLTSNWEIALKMKCVVR